MPLKIAQHLAILSVSHSVAELFVRSQRFFSSARELITMAASSELPFLMCGDIAPSRERKRSAPDGAEQGAKLGACCSVLPFLGVDEMEAAPGRLLDAARIGNLKLAQLARAAGAALDVS